MSSPFVSRACMHVLLKYNWLRFSCTYICVRDVFWWGASRVLKSSPVCFFAQKWKSGTTTSPGIMQIPIKARLNHCGLVQSVLVQSADQSRPVWGPCFVLCWVWWQVCYTKCSTAGRVYLASAKLRVQRWYQECREVHRDFKCQAESVEVIWGV